ncbi:hypothetical protein EDB83DRAFT_2528365 [Lactarius deliciosus]|nr:hypothetical protein EDB83DRAFT_2528365 [Lactarius deliciosus]
MSRSRTGTAQKVSLHISATLPTYDPPLLHPSRRAHLRPPLAQTGTQGDTPAPLPIRARKMGTTRPPQSPLAQATPVQPHALKKTVRLPRPLCTGDASPTPCTSHRTACARKV